MVLLSTVLAALPCFGAAAVFLTSWIDPYALGDRICVVAAGFLYFLALGITQIVSYKTYEKSAPVLVHT